MSIVSLWALAGAMLIFAATPGAGVFATLARALASGFKHSAFVVLGIVTGDIIFLLFAIYGLSIVAEQLHGMFLVVKYVGAGYLIYLGLKLWQANPSEVKLHAPKAHFSASNFLSGLFITLGNPKVVLFYLSFLPSFLDLKNLSGSDVLAIAAVIASVLSATLLTYGYAASKTRDAFKYPKRQKLMNRAAGSTMIATGAFCLP